jgi:hypothetical protein
MHRNFSSYFWRIRRKAPDRAIRSNKPPRSLFYRPKKKTQRARSFTQSTQRNPLFCLYFLNTRTRALLSAHRTAIIRSTRCRVPFWVGVPVWVCVLHRARSWRFFLKIVPAGLRITDKLRGGLFRCYPLRVPRGGFFFQMRRPQTVSVTFFRQGCRPQRPQLRWGCGRRPEAWFTGGEFYRAYAVLLFSEDLLAQGFFGRGARRHP